MDKMNVLRRAKTWEISESEDETEVETNTDIKEPEKPPSVTQKPSPDKPLLCPLPNQRALELPVRENVGLKRR